jgi:hypothetical protein
VDRPTVLGGLAAAGYRISTSGASERQGVVSRLDVGTSGLMVVCKSERAYSVLKRAFKHRTVDKTYHALVQGLPDPLVGTIDAPDRAHRGGLQVRRPRLGRQRGHPLRVVEAFRHASLLEIHLETGRTHQIRVHFAALHHPCCGDLTYGADPTLAARLGLERTVAARRPASGSSTRPGTRGSPYSSPFPRGPPARPRRDRDLKLDLIHPVGQVRSRARDARIRVCRSPPRCPRRSVPPTHSAVIVSVPEA